MKPTTPTRRIFNKANEELVYSKFVKTGILTIDSQGRVWKGNRRMKLTTGSHEKRPVLIKWDPQTKKYIHCSVGRLVYFHFNGRIPHMKVITVKNGNQFDTRPKNLICCDHSKSISMGAIRSWKKRKAK